MNILKRRKKKEENYKYFWAWYPMQWNKKQTLCPRCRWIIITLCVCFFSVVETLLPRLKRVNGRTMKKGKTKKMFIPRNGRNYFSVVSYGSTVYKWKYHRERLSSWLFVILVSIVTENHLLIVILILFFI